MSTAYPSGIDNNTTLPQTIDLVTPVKAEVPNLLREAILAIEAELGVDPSREFGTVRARIDSLSDNPPGVSVIKQNGTVVVSPATKLNFTGHVIVTNAGNCQANVAISTGAANVGTGAGIFRNAVSGILNFRSLVGINGISTSVSGDEVDIDGYDLLPLDGSRAMTSSLDLGTNLINNVVDPVDAQDAATKHYVDGYFEQNNEWSEILANGNTTGGTNPKLSSGDKLIAALGASEIDVIRMDVADLTIGQSAGFSTVEILSPSNINLFASGGAPPAGQHWQISGTNIELTGPAAVDLFIINNSVAAGDVGGDLTITAGDGDNGFDGGDTILNSGQGGVGGADGYVIIQRGDAEVARFDGGGSERLLLQTDVLEFESASSTIKTTDGSLNISTGDTAGNSGSINVAIGTSEGPAGNISLYGGDSNNQNGGAINLYGGDGDTFAGGIWIQGGQGGSGIGGSFNLYSGSSTSGAAGSINMNTGSGAINGGNISVSCGSVTSGNGGTININGGASNDATGGAVNIDGGSSSGGTGGAATVQAGNGTTLGGAVTISSGQASAGWAGSLTLETGSGTTFGGSINLNCGATSAGTGGNININPGDGSTFGGNLNINGASGTVAGGGNIYIAGGPNTGTGDAGSIYLRAGAATHDGDGYVIIQHNLAVAPFVVEIARFDIFDAIPRLLFPYVAGQDAYITLDDRPSGGPGADLIIEGQSTGDGNDAGSIIVKPGVPGAEANLGTFDVWSSDTLIVRIGSATGGDIQLSGSGGEAFEINFVGDEVTQTARIGFTAQTSGDVDGVPLRLRGQDAHTDGATDQDGGDIYFTTGQPTGSGSDGSIVFFSGTGPVEIARLDNQTTPRLLFSDADDAHIEMEAVSAGVGNDLYVTAGAGASGSNGGDLWLESGDGPAAGVSGSVRMRTGGSGGTERGTISDSIITWTSGGSIYSSVIANNVHWFQESGTAIAGIRYDSTAVENKLTFMTSLSTDSRIEIYSTVGGSLALQAGENTSGTGGNLNLYGGIGDTPGTNDGYVNIFNGDSLIARFDESNVFINNANAVPTNDPEGGAALYVESGTTKVRSPNSVITTIAPNGTADGYTQILLSEVGTETTGDGYEITLLAVTIPTDYFGIIAVDITAEEQGAPANAYGFQNSYLVSNDSGVVTIRDNTLVPNEMDPQTTGVSGDVDADGATFRVRVTGNANENWMWNCHVGGLLAERSV